MQIFRVGQDYGGKIVDRIGPFSRSTTIPLCCKGFTDPEQATRGLAHLPQSALRHRIHVLSGHNRGVEKFIYVGSLGLLGGGDRAPPSSSDALGHQTAESSASHSAAQRDLIESERSLIRKFFGKKSNQSIEKVVKAFNETDDDAQKTGLAKVLRKIICVFNEMPVGDIIDNQGAVIHEYQALCTLHSVGGEHLPLHKDLFDGIWNKLYYVLNDRHVMEAVEHTLQIVDTEVFEADPSCLVKLAELLFDAFDPDGVSFSKEMFPLQCSAMYALLECLRILHDVHLGNWNPEKLEWLYAKFEDWSQRAIDLGRHYYYPLEFQATLAVQSLNLLRSCRRAVRKANNARLVANLAHCAEGKYQAVRGAVHLDFDLGKAGSVTRALLQAFLQTRHGKTVCEDQWCTCLHAMSSACFAAMDDLLAFEVFSELLSFLALNAESTDDESRKALRFGVAKMLSNLAVYGKDGVVRGASIETLASLVERIDKWDWLSDPDLFIELLDNLSELSVRGYEDEKREARKALRKLALNVHTEACEEALSKWRGGKTVEERIESLSSDRSHTLSNVLFSQVWKSVKKELSPATTGDRSQTKKDRFLTSPYITRHFAGRKEEFSELMDAFTSTGESVFFKAIVGPGGIGKTQLAIKVFDQLKSKGKYDHTFWIPSDSRESLSTAFFQMAEYLNMFAVDDVPELVKSVYEELGGSSILYVFDDAPNLEMIREYLPPAVGHVIVTTRDVEARRGWESNTVQLGPFEECEAWLLAQKFGYTQSSRSKGLDDLLDLLPLYPLTLAQFFSMMNYENVRSPAKWLEEAGRYSPSRSEARAIEMLSKEHDLKGASAMVFLFRSSVLSISREPGDIGTHSLDILTKLALLDPNGVPIEWVYKWYEHQDKQSETRTQKSIRLLERFSYVSWNTDNKQIYVHAETQLLARYLILQIDDVNPDQEDESRKHAEEKIKDHVNAVVHSIDQYAENWRTDESSRELWTSLARNGVPLLKHSEKGQDTGMELKLVRCMAKANSEMCMFCESLSFCMRALEMCERLHAGADHPDLVKCIKNYSVGLSKAGRDNEALPFRMRALEMCERLHAGADHPDLVECIMNYSAGLSKAGRDNEALPFDMRALEMCERLHAGADHPDLVECIMNYSAGLSKAGRDNEALPFCMRALEMCERLHAGADHPDLVKSIKNYSVGLSKAGRDNEALPFDMRALEMCERLHAGADHPDLVQCIMNYSAGLSKAGRDNEALPFDMRALEMCERLHAGADHPDLVKCIKNYSVGLSKAGRDNEALPFDMRALEMCERLHAGADHPDLVQCIMNYSAGLSEAGRDNEALPFDMRALEMCERLHAGADHPDLVECIMNYSAGLSEAGRDNEALPFCMRALEMCERLHAGGDHPDLVECIKNYSVGLSKAGRDNEVLPFCMRALEMCERLHAGADHPDLVECIKNYSVGLSKAGRDNEAVAVFERAEEMSKRLGDHLNPPLS